LDSALESARSWQVRTIFACKATAKVLRWVAFSGNAKNEFAQHGWCVGWSQCEGAFLLRVRFVFSKMIVKGMDLVAP
jgi:hypothetical protein